MRKLALVLVGGFGGTLARYLLSAPLLAAGARLPGAATGVPYDILAINLSGALALGLLYGLFERGAAIPPDARLALGTGFLGAYTTFSSLVVGGDRLLAVGQVVPGVLYIGGSMALGVLSVRLGHLLAGSLVMRRRLGLRLAVRARRMRQRLDGALVGGGPLARSRLTMRARRERLDVNSDAPPSMRQDEPDEREEVAPWR
jgi:CrcB protein